MAIRGPRDLADELDQLSKQTAEPDLIDDGIQPAGFARSAGRQVAGQILEPLTKRGARVDPDYKVTEEITKPVDVVDPDIQMPEPPVEKIEPQIVPPIKKPAPVSEERVEEVMAERQEAMGGARQVPSPTKAQVAEGIEAGPVNTRFYDSDSLAATVKAVAGDTEPDYQSQTVESLYKRAFSAGVPKKTLDAMFRGVPMQSKVGNNQLATQLAGLQALHDVSAQNVDELMTQAASGLLTDLGKFELREALAQHEIVLAELKGAKRDVARSMNVFKGARERNLPALDIRAVLDGVGGDQQLRALADNYIQQENRAAKNKILEVGLSRKTYDSMIYAAQSTFLTNWETHLFNATANGLTLFMDVPERAVAIPIGKARQRLAKVLGKEYRPDEYYGQDIYARTSAFYNGLMDGWSMMAKGAKTGATKDAPRNPISSAYFSNTPIMMLGKEVARTPELKNTIYGRTLDALGALYSIPMRALGAGDQFFGGIAQRMELHEQAWRYGATIYDKKLADGASADEALASSQEAVNKFLTERPAEVEASVQSFRKQATLMADIDRQSALGRTYHGALKIMNNPLVKPIMLFSKSVTNLAIEGAARVPVLNFMSPRFYNEWEKGGRHRDLAISRMVVGGSLGLGSYFLAHNGRLTGAGPADTEERNNLKSLKWQDFSMRFDNEEMSDANIARLNNIMGAGTATRGTGTFKGSTFVSLKRMEPVTIPLLLGAAFADAQKYRAYDPDDTQTGIMFDAMMASLAEYSTNMPAMQSVNELMRILNQRQTDSGDKVVAMFDAYMRQVGNVAIAGTPVVGLANSAIVGKIERILDPALSNTAVNQEQVEWADDVLGVDATQPGIRAFFEAYNKMMSRVPTQSNKLPPKRDARGNPIEYDKDYSWMPLATAKGKRDEVSEILAGINHGIGNPNFTINGVRLPAEQQDMYLKLQQDPDPATGMTMDEAIIQAINDRINDAEALGIAPPLGSLQNDVDQVVADYRARARNKMFGKNIKDKDTGLVNYTMQSDDGAEIMYPDTAAKIARNQEKANLYGR